MLGGSGDDVFRFTGADGLDDGDSINGYGGTDTIDVRNSAATNVVIDFADVKNIENITVSKAPTAATTSGNLGIEIKPAAGTANAGAVTVDLSAKSDATQSYFNNGNSLDTIDINFTIIGGLQQDIIVGSMGEDTITGQFKMTMGIDELESGMALVPLLIGVFVISEVIIQAEKAAKVKMIDLDKSKLDDPTAHYFTWPEFKRCFPLMFRSSIYGSLIGMMPGLGSSVACFVAYGEEKRKAKNKDQWGTGGVEGIAAPESANNAVSGPSMIPLLTLGIPGSTIAAVLIGMFLVNGLQVGPQIFATEPPLFVAGQMMSPREFIFGIFAAGLVGIACYAIIGYFAAPMIGRAIAVLPTQYLYPVIFMISLAGVPPLAGFVSKLLVIMGIVKVAIGQMGAEIMAGGDYGLADVHWVWWLALAMVINSAISMFYYLRVGVVMFFEEPEEGRTGPLPAGWQVRFAILACLMATLFMGVASDQLLEICEVAAKSLNYSWN